MAATDLAAITGGQPQFPLVELEDLLLNKLLSSGAFCRVYAGSYNGFPVALRRYCESVIRDYPEIIRQEATVMHKLQSQRLHPNIVVFYGLSCSPHDGVTAIMELCQMSLRHHLEQRDPSAASMTNAIKLNYALQIAHGLRFIHSNGIVHLNIKLDNILVTLEGRALKLAGFGMARNLRDEEGREIITQEIAGTPGYMAPEIFAEGGYRLAESLDIYAIGVVLAGIFLGYRFRPEEIIPNGDQYFSSGSLCEFFRSNPQWRHNIEGCGELHPRGFDQGIRLLIESCWRRDPRQRPTTSSLIDSLNILGCLTEDPASELREPSF
jgi:serine/threonine protein kinase